MRVSLFILLDIVDNVLKEDDLDGDGYLTYAEYALARKKEDAGQAAAGTANANTHQWFHLLTVDVTMFCILSFVGIIIGNFRQIVVEPILLNYRDILYGKDFVR